MSLLGRIIVKKVIVSMLAGFTAACSLSPQTAPPTLKPSPIDLDIAPTGLAATPTFVPPASPTASPSPVATQPSQTLLPSFTPTLVPLPVAVLQFNVRECEQTFCPPPELDLQASVLNEVSGIYEASAFDELAVTIRYDPTVLTEQEVIGIFESMTGLTAVQD